MSHGLSNTKISDSKCFLKIHVKLFKSNLSNAANILLINYAGNSCEVQFWSVTLADTLRWRESSLQGTEDWTDVRILSFASRWSRGKLTHSLHILGLLCFTNHSWLASVANFPPTITIKTLPRYAPEISNWQGRLWAGLGAATGP